MSDGRDDDLRARFAALRREEGEAAPGFAESRARARRRSLAARAPGRRRVALRLAALAVALGWLGWRSGDLRRPAPPPPDTAPVEASILAWRPATDGLLSTFGRELIATTPTLGRMPTFHQLDDGAGSASAASRRSS
jgi:hypothetical protein